jgi:hypothetical protein
MKTFREMINLVESNSSHVEVGTKLPGGWTVVKSGEYSRAMTKTLPGDIVIKRVDGYVESRSMHTGQGNGIWKWKPRVFVVKFPDGTEQRAISYREAVARAKGEW